MKNQTKILLGIAGAALAGTVIGLLMAPDKGSETRKKIKHTADDWAGRIRQFAGKAQSQAQNLADEAEDAIHEAQNKAGKVKAALS